ncbi:MAG: ATPase [Micromonosporaceae bacterium]|nr:ATPase [Micromonosporaceae bacterium]
MTGRRYVAIDGGNSKTHVVVGTTAGEVLAFVSGPGSSPDHLGIRGSMALLGRLVAEAVGGAGLPAATVLDQAEVYLAGVDLPVEVESLSGAVGAAGWARRHRLENDLFALLRAGTSAADAVAVVCGAGINCLGRAADGRTARFPSLGQISGDWGGGHHLAEMALWHAARGEDGRGPTTGLTAVVADHFGRSTVGEVSAGLHLGELDRGLLPGLTPALFAVAAAGDAVARRIVTRQAHEVVAMVRVAAGRLGLTGREFTVVLGGGVLVARHPPLHDVVVEGIHAVAPQARVGVLAEPPVAGAALLALDALGVKGVEVEAAVRSAIRAALPR